jgi:KDO2-lipid IV(A) lauroyltransferase
MKDAPIQHWLEFQAFRLFRAWALARPHAEVRKFGAGLGRFAWRVLGGQRRRALSNVEKIFPERPAAEREAIVKACFEHYGAYFCEVLSCGRMRPDEILGLFDVEGFEHVEALRAERGGGFFATTGHYGSSEIAIHFLGQRLAPFSAVGRPLDNPRLDAEIRRIRELSQVVMLDKGGAARRMLSAVRKGGVSGVIYDQHVRPESAIRIPFLGRPAWTSPLLGVLATRQQIPVLPFLSEPIAGGRYKIVFYPPVYPEGRGPEAEAEMTARCQADLEAAIRRRPELWLWMHRRWRD